MERWEVSSILASQKIWDGFCAKPLSARMSVHRTLSVQNMIQVKTSRCTELHVTHARSSRKHLVSVATATSTAPSWSRP